MTQTWNKARGQKSHAKRDGAPACGTHQVDTLVPLKFEDAPTCRRCQQVLEREKRRATKQPRPPGTELKWLETK